MAAMNSLGLQALLDKLVSVKGELAWVILGQVLAFSGGIVTIKVLTNMMGAANYGVLALGLTIAGFMNMFIYGPIGQAVSRFFSIYRERDKVETYYGLVWQSHGWAFVLVAVLAVAGAVLSGIVADRRWGVIILVAAAFGMIGGWNGTAFNMLSAMRKRKIAALSQGIESWVRLFIAILAIYLVGGSGGAVLAGYVIGALLVFIAIATTSDDVGKVMMQRKEPRGLPWKLSYGMREYLKYAGAFSMFAIPAAVSTYADRWMIQGLFGEAEVGGYVAVYQIANAPIALFLGVANQLMIPIIYEKAGAMTSRDQGVRSRGLLYLLIISFALTMIPVIAVAYFFGEPVVEFFTNTEFAKYHHLLWLLVVVITVNWVGNLMSIEAEYHNKPAITFWPKMANGLSFLLLTFLLGKTMGIVGIALALGAASVVYVLGVAWALKGVRS